MLRSDVTFKKYVLLFYISTMFIIYHINPYSKEIKQMGVIV